MRNLYSALAIGAALSAFAMHPGEVFSQPNWNRDGREQVCVYEHADFGGWEQCFGVGENIRDLGKHRNQISSVRIQGRARLTLFEHPNFGGRAVTIDNSVANLSGRFRNDDADSLQVASSNMRGIPDRGDRRDDRRADRVCVYEHIRYQGRSECFGAGDDIRNLESVGFNDGISSIRTFGRVRATFYEHSDYKGQRISVDGDNPDLTRAGWNDRISSLRVGGERRGGR